jgi:hypothetical protein
MNVTWVIKLFNRVFLVLCVIKPVCGPHLGVYFIVLFTKQVKQNGNALLSSVRKCEALWAGPTVVEQNNKSTSYTPPFWYCDHALFDCCMAFIFIWNKIILNFIFSQTCSFYLKNLVWICLCLHFKTNISKSPV